MLLLGLLLPNLSSPWCTLSTILLLLLLLTLQFVPRGLHAEENVNPLPAGGSSGNIKSNKLAGGGEGGKLAAKKSIIRDFVSQHGEAIRRSRRHADLFDGSGYLIDVMEELHEYESRAEDHRRSERKRRSATTNGDKDSTNGDKDSDEPIPDFASLSEALTHLNDGDKIQKEVLSPGFNLRFVNHDEEGEDKDNDENQDENKDENKDESEAKKERKRRRQRRSSGRQSANNDEDEDEYFYDGEDRQKAAEASMKRLDATLLELAKFLDEDEQMDSSDSDNAEATKAPLFSGFNRHIGNAYKSLVQLREQANELMAEHQPGKKEKEPTDQKQQPEPDLHQKQPPRLSQLFLGKTANWQIDADALRENVKELEKLYRHMDEL